MKFIKYNFLALAFLGLIFGCDPLDETYVELDELEDVNGADADVSIEYTVSEEDYGTFASTVRTGGTVEDSAKADFIDQYNAFNSSIAVSTILEDFVNEEYPQLQKGAAVRVTYNILEGEMFEDASTDYVNALEYELDADDYASVSAEAGSFGFFDSGVNVSSAAAGILSSAIQSPSQGDIAAASFEVVNVAYSSLTGETVFTENFETDLGAFETVSVSGDDQEWEWGTFGDDTYARMSGFSGGAVPNEDWLISPAIDLTAESGGVTLSIAQILNFQGDSQWGGELDILYTTGYTGDATTTTWISVGENLSSYPEGSNYDVYDADVSLPDASGNTVNVAFSYKSTSDFAALWEIVNFRLDVGAAPETDDVNLFFEYDGAAWEALDEAYFLGSADYDAMGAPGRFNNFSDSDAPEEYLPSFLAMTYPFAQEGDEIILVYKYFAGSTTTRGSEYVFESGTWEAKINVDQLVQLTDQYKNTGDGFVFNPSVTLTMSSDDYQIIVEEVKKTRPELISSFGTGEDLYGADSFFNNFDTRLSSRLENDDNGDPLQPEYTSLSTADAEALIAERVIEGVDVFLEAKYADVQPIEGIEILYTISFATFDGNGGSGTHVFVLTGPGTFEYVGE